MAWGYWSATAVDRGRSPRRNTQQTMPVNIIPQSEPPAPSQPQQQQQTQQNPQQQCYSPTCRSRCTSPCPGSPCPGSPCESVNSPPQSAGGSGGGGGSGSIMIQCQSQQCQQNCGHGGYTSRKESLDRLDSPQVIFSFAISFYFQLFFCCSLCSSEYFMNELDGIDVNDLATILTILYEGHFFSKLNCRSHKSFFFSLEGTLFALCA